MVSDTKPLTACRLRSKGASSLLFSCFLFHISWLLFLHTCSSFYFLVSILFSSSFCFPFLSFLYSKPLPLFVFLFDVMFYCREFVFLF